MSRTEKRGARRTPLNRLFGAESHVRILRVLTEIRHPLGKAELARKADLDPSGVRRVLDDLMLLGIVEPVGSGNRKQVRLRDEHPLANSVRELFDSEREHVEDLLSALRSAMKQHSPPLQSAWLVEPSADATFPMLQVGILAPAGDVAWVRENLQAALAPVERRFDVTVEVREYTRADLITLPPVEQEELGDVPSLFGPSPVAHLDARDEIESGPMKADRSHADLDRRLLRIGRAIAERIGEDPSLVDRARDYAVARSDDPAAGERTEMKEWASILSTMPLARLQQFLTHTGERAIRLRQSLPFLDALSDEERARIFEETEGDTRAA